MAIYRTLYYTDVTVGVGGRVTIPQDMREDLGIEEGESLTVRMKKIQEVAARWSFGVRNRKLKKTEP